MVTMNRDEYYKEFCEDDYTEFTKLFFERFWDGLTQDILEDPDKIRDEWNEYLFLFEVEFF